MIFACLGKIKENSGKIVKKYAKYSIERDKYPGIKAVSYTHLDVYKRQDNSYELIHQYIDGYKLINWKLIKNENNLGYRKNFKKGLEIVDGDIIFLSDQDDRWHLNKIEVMVEKMSQSTILSLASSFNFMDQDGNLSLIHILVDLD